MKRRDFLAMSGACAMMLTLPGTFRKARASQRDWRIFELTYEVELADDKGPSRLWLPLPQNGAGYQRVISCGWNGTADYAAEYWDESSGAPIFHARWDRPGAPQRIQVTARVATLDRSVGLRPSGHGSCGDKEAAVYLRPSASIPVDGIVGETAKRITGRTKTPLNKARAIYEWMVENTFRDPKVKGCGRGDIRFMLESGNLGGKCADLGSLFVGLARASGIPAREVYGIRVAESSQFKSLGKSGDITKAQHCRAEFYAEGIGWVPVDPADVRKAVLEESLPLTDPRVAALRGRLFGYWEMNWVGFNSARDFKLAPPSRETVRFLMYPYAETASGGPDSLDPSTFRYRISSREITA
jgi:transglutaminase-like putative cysteine protease